MKRKIEVKDIENNVYYKMNPLYFMEILNLVNAYPNNYSSSIQAKGSSRHPERNRLYLVKWIFDVLPMLYDSFYRINTKVFWILTGLIDFPKCAYCHSHVNFIKKNVSLANPYPKCCCMSCSIKFANKFTDTIEKRQHTLDDRYGKDRLAIRMKMSATKLAFSSEKKRQILEKRILSTRLHYGYDHIFLVPSIIESMKLTHLKNLGVENPTLSPIILEKHKAHMSDIVQKRLLTMKTNGTFCSSKQEDKCYHMLHFIYPHIIRQYRSQQYPFNCDFYDPDSDTYFEYNGSWTHGGHFFDLHNDEDIKIALQWKDKSTLFYLNALLTWTIRDVLKRNTAIENKLNYVVFWNMVEVEDFVIHWNY